MLADIDTDVEAPATVEAKTVTTAVRLPAGSPLHLVFHRGSGDSPDQALKALIVEVGVRSGRMLHWHPAGGGRVTRIAAQAAAAAQRDGGIVVAVGGDGTVSAVAHEAVNAGVPMAVMPVGTFNLFARAQGIPLDLHEAARALLAREVRRVAVGRVGDQVFVVSASLGLHPDLIDGREQDTQRFGRGRRVAWLSALARLWQQRQRLSLQLSGEGAHRRIDASTVLISNNPVQLAAAGAAVAGRPGDDLDAFHVLVVPPRQGVDWLPLLWNAARGKLREAEGVEEHRLRQFTLHRSGRRSLKLALDGEVRRVRGPLVLRFEPGALQLVGLPHP